jgi:hypothetical protein
MAIISNKLGQSTTLHFNASNTVTIVGNTSSSGIAMGSEVVSGAAIRRLWCGGAVTVARGANVVFQSTQSGYFGFADHGNAINLYTDATLVITMTGSNFIMIELSKKSDQAAGSGPAGTG